MEKQAVIKNYIRKEYLMIREKFNTYSLLKEISKQ